MRIERGQHSVDGALDHLGLIRLFNVVGANFLEHVTEQIELTIRVGRRRESVRGRRQQDLRRKNRGARPERDAQRQIRNFANYPRAFSMFDFAHHGPGSIAASFFLNSI